MDSFDKAELEGRGIIEAIISGRCIAYEFTESKYDHVDCFITGLSSTAVMEIKHRSAWTSTEIERMGGQLIERTKYDALKENKGYKPIYAVIYSDIVAMWDITDMDESDFHTVDKFPSTTMGKNPHKATKEIAYLSMEDATRIRRKPKEYGKDEERHNNGT